MPVPSPEQERARELFLRFEGLRIDAYAGSGKTTTLRMLANATTRRGLYVAFNRSIAEEARQRFPSHVSCATAHSLAYRAVRRSIGYQEWKLTSSLTPNMVVGAFRMPEHIGFRSGLVLPKWSYCAALLDAVKRFLQSEDEIPSTRHIPRYGVLEALPDAQFEDFCLQAVEHVQAIWGAMQHRDHKLPLGYDGYLKLWSLSKPAAQVDYILVDEAQDLNPVLLSVLRQVRCPVVYVGDPYQQIYDWRGAVNAMEQIPSSHHVSLTQSYRFGPAIANAASLVIRELGAELALRGIEDKASHVARVQADVVLSRTNAGVIGNILRFLARGQNCHVLGGTKAMESLLTDVQKVKQGIPSKSPELLGFASWKDVMSFSAQPEGEYLRGLVNLVQEYGEGNMLRGLVRCEPEERNAEVICSTTHKAKGREWRNVLVDEDFADAILKPPMARVARTPKADALHTELRLFYVAVTRAQHAVQLPASLMTRFRLASTSDGIIERTPSNVQEAPQGVEDASLLSGVVSPYHSPQAGEPRELAALRRILSGR